MSRTFGGRTHWQLVNEIQMAEPSFAFTDDGRDVRYTYVRAGVVHQWQMRRTSVFVRGEAARADKNKIANQLQSVFRAVGGPDHFFHLREQRRERERSAA